MAHENLFLIVVYKRYKAAHNRQLQQAIKIFSSNSSSQRESRHLLTLML